VDDRRIKILSSNLHGLIPVGDCADEEGIMEGLKEQVKQHDTLIDALEQNYARFQSQVQEQIKNQYENLSRLEKSVDKITTVVNKLVARLTNGWGDTLKRHEVCLQDKATYQDLNGAIGSVRNEVRTLKWMVGFLIPAMLGLVSAMIFI
jgi:predicted nuclease with TOPRIM domain